MSVVNELIISWGAFKTFFFYFIAIIARDTINTYCHRTVLLNSSHRKDDDFLLAATLASSSLSPTTNNSTCSRMFLLKIQESLKEEKGWIGSIINYYQSWSHIKTRCCQLGSSHNERSLKISLHAANTHPVHFKCLD